MTRPIAAPATAALLAMAIVLGACTPPDPFTTPGTWTATGANAANLRAMVANPADLDAGIAAGSERGDAAAKPIAQLRAGRRPALPAASVTTAAPAGGQDAPR